MVEFELTWNDKVKATDERIVTNPKTGDHSYRFKTKTMQDARKVVATFMRILPEHNFRNHRLKEVKK